MWEMSGKEVLNILFYPQRNKKGNVYISKGPFMGQREMNEWKRQELLALKGVDMKNFKQTNFKGSELGYKTA